MYAITFDLDTKKLEEHYPSSNWRKAYDDVAAFLEDNGFTRQQSSVYYGDESINAVTCVTVAQALSDAHDWLSVCTKDIRMLRIEENNDLMPAIQRPSISIKGKATQKLRLHSVKR